MTLLLEQPDAGFAPDTNRSQPSRLDRGIAALRGDIRRMITDTSRMLRDALIALHTGNTALAEAVVLRDDAVDAWEQCLETQAIRLVAAHQPLASDLRFVGNTLKVTTDIERIADHAVNIAHIAMRLKKCSHQTPMPLEIERMGNLAIDLLCATAEAFAQGDAAAAQTVVDRDDEMDVLYREAQTELRYRMRTEPEQSVAASHLLFVAHYLERVGDHCANVAERVAV